MVAWKCDDAIGGCVLKLAHVAFVFAYALPLHCLVRAGVRESLARASQQLTYQGHTSTMKGTAGRAHSSRARA